MMRFLLVFSMAAAALAQPAPPVITAPVLAGSPPGGIGAGCTAGLPFYANLTTGVMVSCQSNVWTVIAGSGTWTIPFSTSGTSGSSTGAVSFQTTGFSYTLVEPTLTLGDSITSAIGMKQWQSGLQATGNYTNQVGMDFRSYIINGFNQQNGILDNKNTIVGSLQYFAYIPASGQRSGFTHNVFCFGLGDCLASNVNMVYDGSPNGSGDEGGEVGVHKVLDSGLLLVDTINGATAMSPCNTTLTGNVTNVTTGSPAVVMPVASTTGCLKDQWINLDPGVGSSRPEAVQIQAVGAGTLSAYIKAPHLSGAAIKGGRRVPVNFTNPGSGWGQNRTVVNSSLATYSTGTAATTQGSAVVTGIGTSWNPGGTGAGPLAGGSTYSPGCFREVADDESHAPYNGAPPFFSTLHNWVPILTYDSNTQITLTTQYLFTNSTGAYVIAPCAQTLAFDVGYSASAATIDALVLGYNTFTWTNGDTIEQIPSVAWEVQRVVVAGVYRRSKFMRPTTVFYDGFMNDYGQARSVLQYEAANLDSSTYAQMHSAVRIIGNTLDGVFSVTGKDMSGILLGSATYNSGGVKDSKAITWSGASDGFLSADVDTNRLFLGNSTSKVQFTDNRDHPLFGALWDFSAPVNAFSLSTITVPNASGGLSLITGTAPTDKQPACFSVVAGVTTIVAGTNIAGVLACP